MDVLPPPGIPTVSTPPGPFTGAPAVTVQDRLNPFAVPGGFGTTELTATDPSSRRWTVLAEDFDGAVGGKTFQFPDLSGVGGGLATGSWLVGAEQHLYLSSTMVVGDVVLAERFRQQAAYALAQAVAHVVN